MKAKYVEETYGFWFEFGSRGPGSEGLIDIASSDQRMDIGPVRRDVAEVLMAAHNRVHHRLVAIAQAFDEAAPEAFSKFWYEAEG